jgi:hypothetical protein
MPCYTKVLVELNNDKWTLRAKEKLGITGTRVSEEDAARIRVEAGKLKTIASIRLLSPTAIITGTTIGSKKLTIQVNI